VRDDINTWSKQQRAGSIVLISPDGERAGSVEIHDRRRPMRPVRAIVEDLRGDLTVASCERLTTSEGEHAAIVTLRGTDVERTLAIVYGDDFHVLIDGVIGAPERFAAFSRGVRELVEVYKLGLSEHRYRRFFYTPPASWQGLARGMITEWYPLDYPARWASLVVHPARPLGRHEVAARAHVVVHQDVRRWLEEDVPPRHIPLVTGRLRGYIVQADGCHPRSPRRLRLRDIGVLEDDHYRYLLTLESGKAGLDEHRELFRAVLESCVPLPALVHPPRSEAIHTSAP